MNYRNHQLGTAVQRFESDFGERRYINPITIILILMKIDMICYSYIRDRLYLHRQIQSLVQN